MSGEGQDAPSVAEMARGQRFLAPNQVDKERVPAWRANLRPYSLWNALRATIIANLGQPFGESRIKANTEYDNKEELRDFIPKNQ